MGGVYQTHSYVLASRGLVNKFASDRAPEGTYANLDNCELRQENAISSRLGTELITKTAASGPPSPLADLAIHTLGRLRSLDSNYRYAAAATGLYRRAGDTVGAYSKINASDPLSGFRCSLCEYRPDFSSFPYLFVADKSKMLKDNGALGAAQKWGIYPVAVPPTVSVVTQQLKSIELFTADAGFTYVNATAPTVVTRVNTTLGTTIVAGLTTVTPAAMTGIVEGMILAIDAGGSAEDVYVVSTTKTTFTATFVNAHANTATVVGKAISVAVAANTTGTVTKAYTTSLGIFSSQNADDEDEISLFIRVNLPANIDEIKLMFDVGDGTFATDYYHKSINQSALQAIITGTRNAAVGISDGVFDRSIGAINDRNISWKFGNSRDGADFLPEQTTMRGLRGHRLLPGNNQYSRVTIKRKDFLKVGLAGEPGHTWAEPVSFRVSIKTVSAGGVTLTMDDLIMHGGGGADVFGGVKYDYRVTDYNANTGAESNGSPVMIKDNWVSPRRQAVLVSWAAPTDPQVTHRRVYRRGGTLPTGWKKVADVAVGTNSVYDVLRDSFVNLQKPLEIDNDPPVTSTLRAPVDTTLGGIVTAGSTQTITPPSMTNISQYQYLVIGDGDTQEQVLVQSITGTTFDAYFQFAHASSERVYGIAKTGQPMNLAAVAFSRVWLAGDTENPHFLYYSKVNRPESFSPTNYIEIGTPTDPIMALVEIRGQLYVITMSSIYQIFGAGGVTPIPFKTATNHGLVASFAWCVVEGNILYLSYDGVYAFSGQIAIALSEVNEWLFVNRNLGQVSPIDPAHVADSVMLFFREMFLAYTDINGARRRIIWDDTYNRWRNDSLPVTAMYYEKDKYQMVVAEADGNIRVDRTNDYDDAGSTHAPIAFTLQTSQLDQGKPKNDKVYNDFTIDIDTAGQNVTVTLLFDNGATPLVLGTVNTAVRAQVQFKVNAGLGRKSRNIALKVTGSVTSVVTMYEVHIGATLEEEDRQSFDTYLTDFGTGEWKVAKQGWFEYAATQPITFSVYIEDSAVASYTFTLPVSTTRSSMRVRFQPVKAKIWRFVGVSSADFRFYNAHVEIKAIGGPKGWTKAQLSAGEP